MDKLREINMPTPEEDAAINVGIAADPDTYEVSDEEFARMRKPGRPAATVVRPMVSMRLDPDVLAHLRASGKIGRASCRERVLFEV